MDMGMGEDVEGSGEDVSEGDGMDGIGHVDEGGGDNEKQNEERDENGGSAGSGGGGVVRDASLWIGEKGRVSDMVWVVMSKRWC